MPAGEPEWYDDLRNSDLAEIYGFVTGRVVCPPTLSKPFLPKREEDGSLIFSTGTWVGTYYTAELVYARELGYGIYPIRGYLFPKKEFLYEEFTGRFCGNGEVVSPTSQMILDATFARFGETPISSMKFEFGRNYDKPIWNEPYNNGIGGLREPILAQIQGID